MTSSDTTPPLPPGYTFLSDAGERPGLGRAVRARSDDGSDVTITVLDATVSADDRFRDYFLAVVERLRHIDHPGIVPVRDLGETAGRAWVVADPPAGRTVAEILAEGTLPARRAIDLLEPLSRALRSASDYGLRHRDLDAANVLIAVDDRAILLEPAFLDPLAAPGARDARPQLLTYIPPERLQQSPPDDRSDVHLLGGLLLTAVTGQPPGSDAARVLRDREREGAVPQELDLVLWRALAADPLQRPATPREFFHQARRALGGEAPERFIRQPQPSVSGAPSASKELVRWNSPGLVSSTGRGPQRFATRLSSTVTGWSGSAGRAVRDAGGGISGLFGRLRPGGREGAKTAASSTAAPPAERDAARDDGDPHPARTPTYRAPRPQEPVAAVAASPGTADDPAARLGEAAARLRRTAGAPDTTVPVAEPAAEPHDEAAAEPQADEWPSTDPAVRLRAERDRRRRGLIVGVAAAAALAAGTAIVLARGDDEPSQAPAPAAETTQQGPVTLTHPPRWQTVDPAPQVLGVTLQDPVALEPRGVTGFVPGSATLVAGRFASTDATLLPPGLKDRLEGTPTPEPIQVGDLKGYRYRGLTLPGEGGSNDLYVFRTSQGTYVVSCFAGEEVTRAYLRQCAAIAGSLKVEGAQPTALGPSPSFGRAMRATIVTLSRDRAVLRRRLARARTPQGQARISAQLARTYRQAAGSTASIFPPAAVKDERDAIVGDMRLVANSYDRLAGAARADNRRAFNEARAQVRRREAQLDASLRALRDEGYQLS